MSFQWGEREAQERDEVRGEVRDTLVLLEVTSANLRNRPEDADAFADFLTRMRQDAGRLRVLCANADDRLIELGLHRLASYLELLDRLETHNLNDLDVFIDVLNGLADGTIEPVADEAEFVRSLPVLRPADLDDFNHLDIEVLLVGPRDVSTTIVTRELQSCGYRVVLVGHAFEALELAVRTRPDLVVAGAVLDSVSGVDLCRLLRALPTTRHIPFALTTSFGPDDARLKGLPDGALVLRKGANFSDSLADALGEFALV